MFTNRRVRASLLVHDAMVKINTDIRSYFTHTMPRPCRSPAMLCQKEFRLCLSHLIFTVRPCLIQTCHAAPMPCHDHAVLKATSQGHVTARHSRDMGMAWHVRISICRPQTACGRPARFRLLPATTRSCTKFVIRGITIR
jgi:hypothetical protein